MTCVYIKREWTFKFLFTNTFVYIMYYIKYCMNNELSLLQFLILKHSFLNIIKYICFRLYRQHFSSLSIHCLRHLLSRKLTLTLVDIFFSISFQHSLSSTYCVFIYRYSIAIKFIVDKTVSTNFIKKVQINLKK